jgi:hypothetical protein
LLIPKEVSDSDEMQVDGDEAGFDEVDQAIRIVDKYSEFGKNIVQIYVRFFETISYIYAFTGLSMRGEFSLVYLQSGFNEQARNAIILAKRYRYIQGTGRIDPDEFALLSKILTLEEIAEIQMLKEEADRDRTKTHSYSEQRSKKRTATVESLKAPFASTSQKLGDVKDEFSKVRNENPEGKSARTLKEIYDANFFYYRNVVNYVVHNNELGIKDIKKWEANNSPTVENVKSIHADVNVLVELVKDSEAQLERKKEAEIQARINEENERIKRAEFERETDAERKELRKKQLAKEKKNNVKRLSEKINTLCDKILNFVNFITLGKDSFVQNQLLKLGSFGQFIINYTITPFRYFIDVLKPIFELKNELTTGSIVVTGTLALASIGAFFYFFTGNLTALGSDFGGSTILNQSLTPDTGVLTQATGLVTGAWDYATSFIFTPAQSTTSASGAYFGNSLITPVLEKINLSFITKWISYLGPGDFIQGAVERSGIAETSLLTFFRAIHQVNKGLLTLSVKAITFLGGGFLTLVAGFIESVLKTVYFREFVSPTYVIEAFRWAIPTVDTMVVGQVTSSPYFVLNTVVVGVSISLRFAYDILKLGFVIIPKFLWRLISSAWKYARKFLADKIKKNPAGPVLEVERKLAKSSLVASVGPKKIKVVANNSGGTEIPEDIFNPGNGQENVTVTLVEDAKLYEKEEPVQDEGNAYGGMVPKKKRTQLQDI